MGQQHCSTGRAFLLYKHIRVRKYNNVTNLGEKALKDTRFRMSNRKCFSNGEIVLDAHGEGQLLEINYTGSISAELSSEADSRDNSVQLIIVVVSTALVTHAQNSK